MCGSGLGLGGELFLVSLDVAGSLDKLTCTVNKQVHPINQENKNKSKILV